MEPYYNSLTLDCYGLADSGAEKSQEVKLNFTCSVVDLQIKGKKAWVTSRSQLTDALFNTM